MIHSLRTRSVGPAAELDFEFGDRLNILTGDNGLGKTFVLDVAWWALTRSWASQVALPAGGHAVPPPSLEYRVSGRGGPTDPVACAYDAQRQRWRAPARRPPMTGLVIYLRVDGAAAVWDPAVHYWRSSRARGVTDPARPSADVFGPGGAWRELRDESTGALRCRGLLGDWREWEILDGGENEAFRALRAALAALSAPGEPLVPGASRQILVDDLTLVPTLVTAYGEVPLTMASSAVQRVVTLAYLLVWAWRRHADTSQLINAPPENRVVLLVDEVDAHLHPKWQRTIVPALLEVVRVLARELSVQLICTTHSPLVLASAEPAFDPCHDRLFDFDLTDGAVTVRTVPWRPHYDACGWLTSDVFGLPSARGREQERAVQDALSLLHATNVSPAALRAADDRLSSLLSDTDPFWVRWKAQLERQGVLP